VNDDINIAKYASATPKFFGTDARMVIFFLLLFFFHMRLWTFILFVAIFTFSFILEYKKVNFLQFMKKIRMFIASGDKKKIRKKY
jgi:hypothetical protein